MAETDTKTTTTSEDMVRETLRAEVYDPELGLNIIDLGLVYDITVADNKADITMTLTSPACPLGPELVTDTLHAAGGPNIYRHHGPDGFLSAPYPPLFYLLSAPFTWITGPSFGPGRAIALVSTVAIAILLVYIVWKITSTWLAGALAGVL